MIRRKLNEDLNELHLTFVPDRDSWYVDDESYDALLDKVDEVKIEAQDLLDVCERQIQVLEREADSLQREEDRLWDSEPDDESMEWNRWNDAFMKKDAEYLEVKEKIDRVEEVRDNLESLLNNIEDFDN